MRRSYPSGLRHTCGDKPLTALRLCLAAPQVPEEHWQESVYIPPPANHLRSYHRAHLQASPAFLIGTITPISLRAVTRGGRPLPAASGRWYSAQCGRGAAQKAPRQMIARGTLSPGALRAVFLFNPEHRVICLLSTAYTKSYSLTFVLVALPFDRLIDVSCARQGGASSNRVRTHWLLMT